MCAAFSCTSQDQRYLLKTAEAILSNEQTLGDRACADKKCAQIILLRATDA